MHHAVCVGLDTCNPVQALTCHPSFFIKKKADAYLDELGVI